ncbi:MAG TPA: ABC transporter substrate-binding protein, partial [Chloroflexota bacterium]|nr:ABC transporter substrate-binding protein [Chloroflexota bacterium]
ACASKEAAETTLDPKSKIPNPKSAVPLFRMAWSDSGYLTPFRVSTTGPGGINLLSLVFDTLTWKDQNGIIPWLATAWQVSGDGRECVFTITKDARWHDRRLLTAEDVAFSFDYYARFPFRWMSTDVVESARASAPDNVTIRLKQPHAAFLEDVAGSVPIIPRHVWEQVTDPIKFDAPESFTGSGPYRVSDYRPAEGAYRLVAHDAYFRGRPRIAEFQSLNVPGPTQINVLRQDGIDLAMSTDYSVREVFQNDPRIKVVETPPHSIVRLLVNTRRPPLDNTKVRQALAYALDRKHIAEVVTKGPAILGSAGVVPSETPWYHPNLKPYPYDPARAKQLFDEAGYREKDGVRFSLELLADPSVRDVELIKPMLEAVGIQVLIKRLDAKSRTQLQREMNYQLAFTTHIGVGGDPDYLRRWYAAEEANDFAQGSVFHHAEYERLGREQLASLDPARRKQIIFKMQEILAEELPTIVLYHRRFLWLYDAARFTTQHTWGGLMNGIPFVTNKLAFL